MPPLSTRFRLFTGSLLLVLGLALLAVAGAGQWSSWGHGYADKKRDWEKYEPALAEKISTYADLQQVVAASLEGVNGNAEKVQAIYAVLVPRFNHDEALHTLASNWILYTAGFVHPTFRHMWSPGIMVDRSHSLLCDQVSYLLLDLVHQNGFRARHIGPQGHVVMEVWYDEGWHLYDPDLEVIPQDDSGRVLSLEELAQNEPLIAKYYGSHPLMPELIRARQNHLYMNTPEGARFDWKANILVVVEQVAEVLKFILPVLMMVAGGLLLWRKKRLQVPA